MKLRRVGMIILWSLQAVFPAIVFAELPTFAPRVGYFAGSAPHSVAVSDLDSDGDLDLAVASFAAGYNIAILLNDSDGTFQPAVLYRSGGAISASVCNGNFDGDEDVDLAVANYSDATFSILKNNGDGTFPQPIVYPILPSNFLPFSATCPDLNGDQVPDLALARFQQGVSGRISILLNDGGGTFFHTGDYSDNFVHWSVMDSDVDGDDDMDLVTANSSGNNVSVFENSGAGSISAITSYPVGSSPEAALGADLDGDGDTDLASANRISHNVSVLIKLDSATFAPAVHYPAGVGPQALVSSDLDRDGDLDLVTADDSGSDSVSILENNGDGTFQPAIRYRAGVYPKSLACASLDGDLDHEIIVASYSTDSVWVLDNLLCTAIAGDANASGDYTLSDIVSIINFIFDKPGCSPQPACWLAEMTCRGDWNGSGDITLSDVIHAVNFIFDKPGGPWDAVSRGACCLQLP